jgi:hypothetical protein
MLRVACCILCCMLHCMCKLHCMLHAACCVLRVATAGASAARSDQQFARRTLRDSTACASNAHAHNHTHKTTRTQARTRTRTLTTRHAHAYARIHTHTRASTHTHIYSWARGRETAGGGEEIGGRVRPRSPKTCASSIKRERAVSEEGCIGRGLMRECAPVRTASARARPRACGGRCPGRSVRAASRSAGRVWSPTMPTADAFSGWLYFGWPRPALSVPAARPRCTPCDPRFRRPLSVGCNGLSYPHQRP